MITRGAFRETLKEWSGRSQPLPLLDSHNAYSTVENVVGKMVSARETEDGLVATFELMPDDPKAAAVYRRIKGGYVDGLSIGFEIAAWEKPTDEERSAGMWRKITRVNLMEVSVVVWPANEQSRITAVKSAVGAINPDRLSEDERRELRALNAQIGKLHEHIGHVSNQVRDVKEGQDRLHKDHIELRGRVDSLERALMKDVSDLGAHVNEANIYRAHLVDAFNGMQKAVESLGTRIDARAKIDEEDKKEIIKGQQTTIRSIILSAVTFAMTGFVLLWQTGALS
jgi:HK97 family phage prohead protease